MSSNNWVTTSIIINVSDTKKKILTKCVKVLLSINNQLSPLKYCTGQFNHRRFKCMSNVKQLKVFIQGITMSLIRDSTTILNH